MQKQHKIGSLKVPQYISLTGSTSLGWIARAGLPIPGAKQYSV